MCNPKDIVDNVVEAIEKVPSLLLSYSYFLNEKHTSYISVGYDAETFKLKILFYKNTNFQVLEWCDWINIYNNINIINNFFANPNKTRMIDLSRDDCNFKLSSRNHEKCWIIDGKTRGNKLIFNEREWERFHQLSTYLNSIISWCHVFWIEIENYYRIYANKCIDLNVPTLSADEFFVPYQMINNYCNYSRLFNEIPVLCSRKLSSDYDM